MHPIYVIYGTESFNTEELAERAGEALNGLGLPLPVEVVDMDDFDADLLPDLHTLLVLTSTYGNGDPPTNAEELHAHLMEDAPELPNLRFSVCGLGDSVYTHFAQCGKDFDRRLGELGATRIVDRQDCDVDYEAPFEAWLTKIKATLPGLSYGGAAAEPVTSAAPKQKAAAPVGTRKNPYMAEVRVNRVLTGPGSSKAVHHVELSWPASIPFTQGDSIGIWAQNDPAEIERVLSLCALTGRETVNLDGATLPISEALQRRDLATLDARLFAIAARAAPHGAFGVMQRDAALRQSYIDGNHVADLLAESGAQPGAQALVDALRPLAPRYYSIASSQQVHPDSVHLLVGIVRYQLGERTRTGVFSGQIAERTALRASLPAFVHPSPSFNLCGHDKHVILIGPGTGVAPYRGFLQERAAAKAPGHAWLFFGDRNRATDFVYADDWQRWLGDGTLNRMDTAFSRDQAEKIYVQHRIAEHGAHVWQWVQAGAVIYVCGDAQQMAPDVHQALLDVFVRHGGLSATAAAGYLRQLEEQGRYQRDVY